ncbi:hypothetical protein T11_12539 [Trichinella zimbabwensis]|uniref:Uncharacterized protein n=1 Tax=Trichinella zimbabwensis TaxID=268475 RepID=A0A0V1HS47_9BILA|nr:hypothetical protein T11_12539 [Trichinella zimbabwensis]
MAASTGEGLPVGQLLMPNFVMQSTVAGGHQVMEKSRKCQRSPLSSRSCPTMAIRFVEHPLQKLTCCWNWPYFRPRPTQRCHNNRYITKVALNMSPAFNPHIWKPLLGIRCEYNMQSFIPEYDIVVFFSVDLTPRALSFMADDHRFMDNLWIAEDENHRVPTSGTMRFNILCLNDKNNRQLVA